MERNGLILFTGKVIQRCVPLERLFTAEGMNSDVFHWKGYLQLKGRNTDVFLWKGYLQQKEGTQMFSTGKERICTAKGRNTDVFHKVKEGTQMCSTGKFIYS